MRGSRLWIGALVMGVIVPSILFFLLSLESFSDYFTVAATCFFAWGLADLAANIIAKPRLEIRTPSQAMREWEQSRSASGEVIEGQDEK